MRRLAALYVPLNDPTLAPSQFRGCRTSTGLEFDMSYLDAFDKAASLYTPENEPTQAITRWQSDMSDAQDALGEWRVGSGGAELVHQSGVNRRLGRA